MPKRSSSPKKRDANQRAAAVVARATGTSPKPASRKPAKNAAAVALGRLGGLKGGKARAARLSPEERRAIARRAAEARWAQPEPEPE